MNPIAACFGLFLLTWMPSCIHAAAAKQQRLMVEMTLVKDAAALGAFCLDGSLPAYHIHRGFGDGARNWLLQFEGGGWCNDIPSCLDRAKSRRGSTNLMVKWEIFSGILGNNASQNPGYFLNPQFQYGGKLSDHREVMEGVQKVIQRLEPNIDKQIQAINQIMMFRDKEHSFGTVLAQKAVTRTNPAEWWIHFGASAPELQEIAVKVLSQTTSSSNCERNWSTFSLIHTKTRNRLKYQKLNKLVYVAYNMRLKIRHATRLSQSEIEDSFNPINLDYIFEEDDPLSPWLQEREEPLLDDQDNSRWLDVSDDEVATSSSQAPRRWQSDSPSGDGSDTESGHGLSPPSGESSGDDGGGGGGGDTRQSPYHGELGMAGFADNVERGDISEPRRHSVSSAIGSSRRRPNPQSSNSEEYDDMENRFGMLGVGGYGYGYQGDNYHQWRQPHPYPYPYYPSSEYVSAPHYVGMGPLGCPQPPTTGYSYPPPPSYQYGVPPPYQESSSSTFGHCEERAESSGTGGSGPSNTIYDHCTFNYFGGYGGAQQNQSGDHADADYEEPARNSFWY